VSAKSSSALEAYLHRIYKQYAPVAVLIAGPHFFANHVNAPTAYPSHATCNVGIITGQNIAL